MRGECLCRKGWGCHEPAADGEGSVPRGKEREVRPMNHAPSTGSARRGKGRESGKTVSTVDVLSAPCGKGPGSRGRPHGYGKGRDVPHGRAGSRESPQVSKGAPPFSWPVRMIPKDESEGCGTRVALWPAHAMPNVHHAGGHAHQGFMACARNAKHDALLFGPGSLFMVCACGAKRPREKPDKGLFPFSALSL